MNSLKISMYFKSLTDKLAIYKSDPEDNSSEHTHEFDELVMDLTLYIQTCFLSYGCDNFLRIYSRGERYPSALWG